MEPTDPRQPVAAQGAVVAHLLAGDAGVAEVLSLLDAGRSLTEVPLVDEAERARLEALAAGRAVREQDWCSLLAREHGEGIGYAGVRLPARPGGLATGDVAVLRDRPSGATALAVLLEAVATIGRRHGAGRVQAWLRAAGASDLAVAADAGFVVERRLGILGRPLGSVRTERMPPPPGVRIRAYRPDEDDDEVVAVLAAAYEGTADGGWTHGRWRERRGYDWFRPDDLLVADTGDGHLAGLHWLKRRGAGVGEVYNLAIRPGAQGGGLGQALLTAGLAHLADAGVGDVLLWVDLANERAVRLYAAAGFRTRWEDVSLVRDLDRRPGEETSGAP